MFQLNLIQKYLSSQFIEYEFIDFRDDPFHRTVELIFEGKVNKHKFRYRILYECDTINKPFRLTFYDLTLQQFHWVQGVYNYEDFIKVLDKYIEEWDNEQTRLYL